MTPIVNRLEEEFTPDVVIVRLDAYEDAPARLQNEYGVRGHPSFVTLDKTGQVQQRFFGPQPETVLRQALEEIKTN